MKGKLILIAFMISVTFAAQAQPITWERTAGPGGGLLERVEAFDDGVLFVAESDEAIYGTNRVFRSNDTGRTWSQITEIFKNSPDQSFAEMSGLIFAEERSGSIYLSKDKGRTWIKTKGQGVIGYDGPYMVPKRDTLFGIVNDAGIFRSIDSSNSWQNVTSNLPKKPKYYLDSSGHVIYIDTVLRYLTCFSTSRTAILVGTDTGVYRSVNGGGVWVRANEGLTDSIVEIMVATGDTVFAATKTGVYRSSDAGIHWSMSKLNQALYIRVNSRMVAALMSDSSYWISTDFGDHWIKQSTSIAARGITCIGLVGSTNFVATLGQGVLRSDDTARTWHSSNSYLSMIHPVNMGIHNHILFVSGQQCGIFQSDNKGNDWSQSLSIGDVLCFYSGMNHFFAADGQELYRSSDGGISWHADGKWNGPAHELIAGIGSIGSELFAGAERGWFVSTDSGSNWSLRSTNCDVGGDVLYTLFIRDTIWDETACDLKMSPNMAHNWESLDNASPSVLSLNNSSSYIHFNGGFGGLILIAPDQHQLTQNLKDNVSNILCTSDRIIVSTNQGVYETTDLGITWQPDTNGIGAIQVYDLVADFDTLYCSTENGVYRTLYKNLLGVSYSNSIQNSLLNRPNPFSESTIVSYSTDNPAFTQVSIHDLLGSEVARLFSGELESGEHSFTWDARGMPAGMYICTIRANGSMQELPMMLVK